MLSYLELFKCIKIFSLDYGSVQVFAEFKLFPQPCSQDWDMKDGGSVNKAST